MIEFSSTFHRQLYDIFRGLPAGVDTKIWIPNIKRTGKKLEAKYEAKAYLPNPLFPAELYEYRRNSNIKLGVEGDGFKSEFAERNLVKNSIYVSDVMKNRVKDLIDLCRQNMNSEIEQELDNEIHLLETLNDDVNKKSLEYHYDLYETVKTFNDFLCITYLHLSNILTYPNESFYHKYLHNAIRIKPDDAMKMANRICSRMQKEFEDIILENFPIKETVDRITKTEKHMPEFKVEDIPEKTSSRVIKKSKGQTEK
jgi:hypothetical protein